MDKILDKLFKLTQKSLEIDDFPVAAIIYNDKKEIISVAYNKRNKTNRTTDHAEIIAIQKANNKMKTWNLQGLNMIVTLEPCDMCKTVIKEARLNKIYYIVERFKYKKQYKCSVFEKYKTDTIEKEQYIKNIKSFFQSKR